MIESTKAVFLSYASQDADAAQRICEALRAAGIDVWFDQSELRGGDAWDQRIKKQIRECGLFVALVSAHTDARPEGYFRLEWKLAVDRSHLMADDEPFLLPIVVDATPDATARVPDKFRQVQWTRLPGGDAPPAFVERVSRLLAHDPYDRVAPARSPPSAGAPRRFGPALLLITGLALLGVGYFALDKFIFSKRALGGTPASAVVSLPVESVASPVYEKSIAVLPFADMSEKKDQEYFSDGLAEELLDLLAKTPGLHVIARTSSFSFKGKSDDIPTIGRKLNVAHILEGGVRKSGTRLRVTTQLIRAGTGEQLWSETYDRELKDVFAVQDEIAAAVAGQLKLKLAPVPPSSARPTSSLEAYNEYLLGQQFTKRETLDGWRRAIEAYRRAIAVDPNYPAPYEGLAVAEYIVADSTADAAGYQRAQAAAAKAVELGPDDPKGYGARGFIRFNSAWDWAGAQADFEKAIALDPGDARFQVRYADLLATLGRLTEAIAAIRKAITLDPLRSTGWNFLAQYLSSAGDFAAAHEANRRSFEISPESTPALETLATLQLTEGHPQDALATFRKVDFEGPRLAGIAMAEYTVKDPKASQQALDELIAKHAGDSAYQIAEVYAWRGDKDEAFEWLERAYAQRDSGLTILKYDPQLDSLRGDPRYQAVLRKMNLPE